MHPIWKQIQSPHIRKQLIKNYYYYDKLWNSVTGMFPSRHLTQIVQRYGNQVLINLLGCKESEVMLSQMFQVCMNCTTLFVLIDW